MSDALVVPVVVDGADFAGAVGAAVFSTFYWFEVVGALAFVEFFGVFLGFLPHFLYLFFAVFHCFVSLLLRAVRLVNASFILSIDFGSWMLNLRLLLMWMVSPSMVTYTS